MAEKPNILVRSRFITVYCYKSNIDPAYFTLKVLPDSKLKIVAPLLSSVISRNNVQILSAYVL